MFQPILNGHRLTAVPLWQVSFEEFQSWIMADAQQEFASKLLHKSSTPAGGRKNPLNVHENLGMFGIFWVF